jgi:hypothetical protein
MTGRERRLWAPITIPSAEFLGRIADHTWFEADLAVRAVAHGEWADMVGVGDGGGDGG